MPSTSPVTVTEVRVLEGPNLYFPKPAIKVELDQLWDLLRQRRALRAAGRNPDDARMRDSETVERYLG